MTWHVMRSDYFTFCYVRTLCTYKFFLLPVITNQEPLLVRTQSPQWYKAYLNIQKKTIHDILINSHTREILVYGLWTCTRRVDLYLYEYNVHKGWNGNWMFMFLFFFFIFFYSFVGCFLYVHNFFLWMSCVLFLVNSIKIGCTVTWPCTVHVCLLYLYALCTFIWTF